jgi:hypothetical protein
MGNAMRTYSQCINAVFVFFLLFNLNDCSLIAGTPLMEEDLFASQTFDGSQKSAIRIAFTDTRETQPEILEAIPFQYAARKLITNELNDNQICATVAGLLIAKDKLESLAFINCLGKLYEKRIANSTMQAKQIGAIFVNLSTTDLRVFEYDAFADQLIKLITPKTHPADIENRILNLVTLSRRLFS